MPYQRHSRIPNERHLNEAAFVINDLCIFARLAAIVCYNPCLNATTRVLELTQLHVSKSHRRT